MPKTFLLLFVAVAFEFLVFIVLVINLLFVSSTAIIRLVFSLLLLLFTVPMSVKSVRDAEHDDDDPVASSPPTCCDN